ncbi:MAG: hypothetical protein GJ676_02455 [Rhodobacteraceae bacterium]|nr:hypothetical protein [Paracoccaceae bacterium]
MNGPKEILPMHFVRSLTGSELRVWLYLRSIGTGTYQIRQAKIMGALNLSYNTVRVAMEGLEEKGALKFTTRPGNSGGQIINVVRIPPRPRKRPCIAA